MPAAFAGSVFSAEQKQEPMQAAARCLGSTYHHMPSLLSTFAQALLCPRAQLCFSLIALIPPSSLRGTEVKTYSMGLQKVKDIASLSPPLFIICSGPETKAAKYIGVVLENSNRSPWHCAYFKKINTIN